MSTETEPDTMSVRAKAPSAKRRIETESSHQNAYRNECEVRKHPAQRGALKPKGITCPSTEYRAKAPSAKRRIETAPA